MKLKKFQFYKFIKLKKHHLKEQRPNLRKNKLKDQYEDSEGQARKLRGREKKNQLISN